MNKLKKAIDILDKQVLNIQITNKRTSKSYIQGFKRAIYILKNIEEEFNMEDKRIICKECGSQFTFTTGEQEFYNERELSQPTRCSSCRRKRKEWNNKGVRND